MQAPPQGEPYIPPPTVIERNNMCDFALQAAPNVLYGRYKQYGQVHISFSIQPSFVLTSTPAGRARMVRRVRRNDRRAEAARDIGRHVRLYERGGAESLRGDPATAARY